METRCSANAWAFSVALRSQVPCGVRRGEEGFVTCFRYLVVFHKEYSGDAVGVRLWRKVWTQSFLCR
jgi:hypothetical protein